MKDIHVLCLAGSDLDHVCPPSRHLSALTKVGIVLCHIQIRYLEEPANLFTRLAFFGGKKDAESAWARGERALPTIYWLIIY